jgi:hypothetical protein
MTNEVDTQGRDEAQELNLTDLEAVTGGAARPDVSGAGKPVWAGVVAPGHGIIAI